LLLYLYSTSFFFRAFGTCFFLFLLRIYQIEPAVKMKNIAILIILSISTTLTLFAQSKTDSLINALAKAPSEDKIELYKQVIESLTQANPKLAIDYSKQLIAFADSTEDLKSVALGYRLQGLVYERQQNHQQSLKAWQANLEIEKKLKNQKNIAYSTMAIASSLQGLARYDEALYYYAEAQKILEEIDDLRGLGFNYGNFGIVYEKMGMYTEAVDNKLKALQIAEQLSDSIRIAQSLGALAASHTNLKEYYKAIDNYTRAIEIYEKIGKSYNAVHTIANLGVAYNSLDENQKARETFNKGLALSKAINYSYGQAIVQMNIGEIMLEMGQADSAMYFLSESNKIFSDLNVQHPLCYNYKMMGMYYQKEGNSPLALEYLEKAFDLSSTINAPDMHRDAAASLSEIYELNSDFDKAFYYHKIFKHYSDSLFNAENIAETTRLEDQYLFDKEQAKTAFLHQAELSKKQTILIFSFTGLALVSILLLLIIIQYRRKNAAYQTLYEKSLEQLEKSKIKKFQEGLKNGELFELLEQKMQYDHLYRIKDLNQDMVADMMKTNRTYVSQAIIDHSGKKFREYIKEYRVGEAMEILSDQKKSMVYSIESIADDVGFNSITTFNAAFKQFTGLTPSRFRGQAGR